jgi:mono/diheme cytochrome c family protein
MISPRMARPVKVLLTLGAALTVGVATGACGTEWISVPKSPRDIYHGAVLFNQRCSGCHTLSYAGARGTGVFVRSKEFNNGPNFDIRCERPATRVLYAIENGGFSGAIMPQNVVVGQDAIDVAKFVATYSGRQAPPVPGVVPCEKLPIGTIPALVASTASGGSATTTTATTATTSTTASAPPPKAKAKTKAKVKAKAKRS